MSHTKANEIRKDITYLESEKAFINSTIALLMADQLQIDEQIALHTLSGIAVDRKIKDLRAELADTV